MLAQEEEDHLIDLMREEEQAEKRRRDAQAAAARRESAKREMLAANAQMLRLKVRTRREGGGGGSGLRGCHCSRRLFTLQQRSAPPIARSRARAPACAQPHRAPRPVSQAEREAAAKAEEDAFRAAALARFAEADRLEQMHAAKRRLRVQVGARDGQGCAARQGPGVGGGGRLPGGGRRSRRVRMGPRAGAVRGFCAALLPWRDLLVSRRVWWRHAPLPLALPWQEHKRAVDAMVAERRAMYEAQRAAEEQEEAARCVGLAAVPPPRACPPFGRQPWHAWSAARLLVSPRANAARRRRAPPRPTPPVAPRRAAEGARKAALVDAERRRLLAEAGDLAGYLPRGVLRGAEDAQLLAAAAAAARGAAVNGGAADVGATRR